MLPSLSLRDADSVMLAEAQVRQLVLEAVNETTGGVDVLAPAVQASISAMREYQYNEALTTTRIRSVVTGGKVKVRHTRLLLVTDPPGTVTQADPDQYCTSKLVKPNWVKVVVAVGCAPALKLSVSVNTSMRLMIFEPLKAI